MTVDFKSTPLEPLALKARVVQCLGGAGNADHAQDLLRSRGAYRRRPDRAAVPGPSRRQGHDHHQCARRTIFDLATRRGLIVIAEDALNTAYDSPVDFSPKDQISKFETRLIALREADKERERSLTFACDADLATVGVPMIKGLLSRASKAAMFGVSRAGKTFIAIDMAFAVALGRPFLGQPATKGAVLIVPLEGRAGLRKRLVAAKQVHGDPGKMIGIMEDTGTLGPAPTSAGFVAAIIASARQLEREAGHYVALIVIDTLAVALAGEDENAAASMAAVLAQVDRITAATGATVLIIHHPSKANPKEMRGSGALFAGCDDVLRIDRPDDAAFRELHVMKAKDGEERAVGTFTLSAVEIGRVAGGDPITSCVVTCSDGPAPSKKAKRPAPSSQAGRALVELEDLVADGKGHRCSGHHRIPDGVEAIDLEGWRAACREKQLSDDGDYEAEKKAFQRARKELSRTGLVADYGGRVGS